MKIKYKKKLICSSDEYMVQYKAGVFYIYQDKNLYSKIKLYSGIKYFFSKVRLLERIFRWEPRVGFFIHNEICLISVNGGIYYLDIKNKKLKIEHEYISGMSSPLNFCKYIDKLGEMIILYGEYTGNVEKKEVNIWIRKNNEWKVFYTFENNTIRHIHQIVYDKYRKEFLIATGDEDSETGIFSLSLDGKVRNTIVEGKQQFRSCFLKPTEKGLIYITDTPLEENMVYFIDYQRNKKIAKIAKISGPCIYGVEYKDTVIFSTSVEPNSGQKFYKYLISYNLGFGVKDWYSHVYILDNNVLREICKFKKDIYPMALAQFGNVQFPSIEIKNNRILLTPCSVAKFDGKTIELEI